MIPQLIDREAVAQILGQVAGGKMDAPLKEAGLQTVHVGRRVYYLLHEVEQYQQARNAKPHSKSGHRNIPDSRTLEAVALVAEEIARMRQDLDRLMERQT